MSQMNLNSRSEKASEKLQNAGFPPWYQSQKNDIESVSENDLNLIIESAFAIISKKYPEYQLRPDQIEMSKSILKNLMNQSIYIVEAGTGIGKSFAYLIAVMAYSYLTGERVIITTETKNLQMQIFQKDLPSLETLLAPGLTFQLALGSSNYFCKLRHDEVFHEGKFRDLISETDLERYQTWVLEINAGKIHGHINELNKPFPDDFWRMIGRDPDGCPGNKFQLVQLLPGKSRLERQPVDRRQSPSVFIQFV